MHSRKIVIIGGGFSGIGMAIRLRQRGIDDFVILERAADHGGTWRDNSYPGCACDVQSSLYSFSFAPNPDWSRSYAPQAEIWAYLRRCATQFDIDRHFVYSHNVTGATWDDETQRWTVTSETDSWLANFVVMASGALSDPIIPSIPGLDTFAGHSFHSAHWKHDLDLASRRVAVIGTGASAIQFIPQIQPRVAHLDVFQRTPPWVLPRMDVAVPAWRRSVYRALPLAQRVTRAALYLQREILHFPFRNRQAARLVEWRARQFREAEITDAALRAKLVPDYRIGCKRILVSDDYYAAIRQPNVSLVTDAITAVDASGILTADGTRYDVDVIILGTGFRPTDPPLAPAIVGRENASLAAVWNGSPNAYMGTTVAGFPNLFMLLGPNTALGHSSVLLMIEAQIEHVLGLLALIDARGAAAVEPLDTAQRAYVTAVDARLASTTWNAGGCTSWYLDRTGRNSTIWPDGVGSFVRTVSRIRADDYRVTPLRAPTNGIYA
jgi:cation diffusion facilitator CzcD-associated flavoprotein CzcO